MEKGIARLVLRILLLLAPFLAGTVFIEYRLRQLTTSYSKKRHDLESKLSRIQLLVLGSSQPLQGLNPIYFSCNAYNLANVSQTLYYDIELTKQYIKKMPELKVVIIPIAYFTLGEELKALPESNREYFYYHYWNLNIEHLPGIDLKKVSLIPVFTLITSLKLALRPSDLIDHIDSNGWKCIELTDENIMTEEKGKARVRQHEFSDTAIRNEHIQMLRGFLALLLKNHIRPVFITTPVYKTYYNNINKKYYEADLEIIHTLSREYGLQYFDYFKDPSFEKSDFSDNDHLNKKGAEKFSKMLNEALGPCQ